MSTSKCMPWGLVVAGCIGNRDVGYREGGHAGSLTAAPDFRHADPGPAHCNLYP